jgi:very-short-patch-repair endonuclease
MARTLINETIAELRARVARNETSDSELALVAIELRHRTTRGALDLAAHVAQLRETLKFRPAPAPAPRPKPTMTTEPPETRPSKPAPSEPKPEPVEPAPMSDERRWTENAVAGLRKKLLDLTKKNPLISYKHSSRGASYLRIVDERPDLLFDQLKDGPMGFEPLPGEEVTPADERAPQFQIAYERGRLTDEAYLVATEKLGDHEGDARAWQQAERALRAVVRKSLGLPPLDYGKTIDVAALARAHGFDPSYDLKASDDLTEDHHEDDKIRVLFTRNELEKQLKKIWEKYRSHARETGLHTLFLVLGFVQWYESDDSDVALHAPLLLLATELDRKAKGGRYDYTLAKHDEGLQLNVALAEKMRESFGLELPALRADETPESYFIRVELVLAKGRRLTLRRFATLAVLPFPRMVLWTDLDPAGWPDGAFSKHPLLPMLLRAKSSGGGAPMGETHDIDAHPWATKAPPLVTLADTSQHSALIDVVAGKSIAIEGPPGTGKSQTITNMIAGALNENKRVLFVAEKQAALSVVAARLRECGFGSLLLELHSDNANRAKLYDSLRQRLTASARQDLVELNVARDQLRHQREVVRRYLGLIGTNIGALGRDVYWLLWREIHLRSRFDREILGNMRERFRLSDADKISYTMLAESRSSIDTFAQKLLEIDLHKDDDTRTRWIEATILPAFDQSDQILAARRAADASWVIGKLYADISSNATLELPQPGEDLESVTRQFKEIESFGTIDEAVVQSALAHPEAARSLLARQFRWRQLCDKLRDDVADPAEVNPDVIAELGESLSNFDAITETYSEFITKKNHCEKLCESLSILKDELELFIDTYSVCSTMTVDQILALLEKIAEFSTASSIVSALVSDNALDPLAKLTIEREHSIAVSLAQERLLLERVAASDAFATSTVDLDSYAATLTDAGFVGRVFGSRYRNAKRKVDRLLIEKLDRNAAADHLRAVSRNIALRNAFESNSQARSFFPVSLWLGANSDWHALKEAQERIQRAYESLARARAEKPLIAWLAKPSRDRGKGTISASQILPIFTAARDSGFATCSIAELEPQSHARLAKLKACDRAFLKAGILPNAMIMRQSESLPSRLLALRAASDDFAGIAAGPKFGWVCSIADPLDALARAIDHIGRMEALPDPLSILPYLRQTSSPVATLANLVRSRETWISTAAGWQSARDKFIDVLGVEPLQLACSPSSWDEMAKQLSQLAADEEGARLAAGLLLYSRKLNDEGCELFVQMGLSGVVMPTALSDLYELQVVRALLDRYLGSTGAELGNLGSLTVDAARKSFVRIDKALHDLEAKAIVTKRLQDKSPRGVDYGPKSNWTEQSLLDSELSLKQPRTPIRDLTYRAGAALQALKPVWMMSPASAAQYIRAGGLSFDLLVVDEASQMRPEYAISSILRGQQFVVVGDTNQLPPTDVFAASTDSDDDGLDEKGEGGIAGMKVDTESILDLAIERFRDRRRLKWHYRSQHESLIQFSNRRFYDRDLVVFPSPTTEDELLGVKHTFVQGAVYDASINQKEAEAVIDEVVGLMRSYPQYSIGIATMNAKQAELIQAEFDRLILESSDIRRYVESHSGGIEEFFIKNLENVQGDERDIIIISTVYGPGKDGVVMQRFGLMNREVGWRRLNVLVTRAKLSTRLVTSLRSSDIKITPTTSRGPIALQAYLTYAETGAQYDDASGGVADSDFEVFVGDALRAAGYDVVPQVGVEGFRIDLGVRHKDYPLGFIAGIECDGASYHSGMSVRDRDRIRQTVLEGLGWNIYRIWSTDWFQDPGRETAKLLSRIAELRDQKAESYRSRPEAAASAGDKPSPVIGIPTSAPQPVSTEMRRQSVEPVDDKITPQSQSNLLPASPEQPVGKPMKPIDGITWFETEPKRVYQVWVDDIPVGDVTVVSRPTTSAQIYGGRAHAQLPEYRGTVRSTGDSFIKHDIYVAVREVAHRARSS